MALFAWFDTKAVDALADQLVRDLVKVAPPDAGQDAAAGKRDAKLRKAHDRALSQARQFALERQPNVYQKARLANRFKWALLEARYPKWFVDEVTYELAAVVGQPDSKRS